MEEVLRAFLPHKGHRIHDLPDNIRAYHQPLRRRVIETEESRQYQPIASSLGQEVHSPFTYAPHDGQVLFFAGLNYRTAGDDSDLDLDH